MKYPNRKTASSVFLRRLIWIGLLMQILFQTALAAEPSGTLSLRDAIDATLAANPQLGVYRFREEAIAGEGLTAALRPPLQLNGGVEDALGSGSVQGIERAEFTLSLSRVVELGDQRDARIAINSQRLQRVQAEQRVTELDLLAEVTRRFIAVATAQERVALQQRAAALAQETLDALEPLVNAGQSPASEQARAAAALERARLAENHERTTLETARISLASMWASQAPQFDAVGADFRNPGEAGALTDLLLALNDNPDVLVFASEERLREAEIREAMSAQRGTVQWTAGLRHIRETKDVGFVFGMSMPLGSRERAAGAIAAAEASLREVDATRDIVLNRMQAQINTLYLQLRQAILEVNTLRDAVLPQLNTAQQQTREAYVAGRYGYLELVSAQREYLDAELALIDAAADAHLLRAEIERLSGAALNPATQEANP
jgi:cobalt-zinc-cadmium efflux system outer membrane protein